jgi:hypothetical protein
VRPRLQFGRATCDRRVSFYLRAAWSLARPLNFTVRSHQRGLGVAKKPKCLRSAEQACEPRLTESSCRRLRLALQYARAAIDHFV